MEVLLGILLALAVLFGIALSRIVTTFIHELGHAIAALLLSKEKVEMYVGSYGDEKKSLKLILGRLSIHLSFIIWDLDMGLVRSSNKVQVWRAFTIILAGPLMSLILGAFFLYLLGFESISDGQKFGIAVLMVSSIWDFFVNVIPRKDPSLLHDGTKCYNDGRQAMDLYRLASSSDTYLEVYKLYQEEDFKGALNLLQEKTIPEKEKRRFDKLHLDILVKLEMDEDYLSHYDKYRQKSKIENKYIVHWARIKIKKHAYDDVVVALTKLLYEGKEDYSFYFLRGKALLELGEYKDALRDFHALTLGEIEDPLALANRAYCQFRLGYEEEAIEDVLQAVDQGKSNMGEIYYLAGVICEAKFEERALAFYKKALNLGYEHHALPFNISRIEKYK